MKNDWQKARDFKKIPHTDMHCHSLTSAPFAAYRKLAPQVKAPPKKFKGLGDFCSFLKNNFWPIVKDLEVARFLFAQTFQRLIEESVIYTEISFDLTVPECLGATLEDYFMVIKQECEKVSAQLKVRAEIGLDREVELRHSLQLFEAALESGIFGGVDLYGDERANPIENYMKIYQRAGERGLKRKAHVGETGTAIEVKEAIERLDLQAIQHGISAAEDIAVMKFLKKKNIYLNICPSSNIALGLVRDIAHHPVRKLYDAGVAVTVNSDDFSVFGKSAGDELLNLYDKKIFSAQEIAQIIDNGLKQSGYEKGKQERSLA